MALIQYTRADKSKFYKQKELARSVWGWNDSSPESIRAAAAIETVLLLDKVVEKLSTIVTLMTQLGQDGIHDLIKEEARRCRLQKDVRENKRRQIRSEAARRGWMTRRALQAQRQVQDRRLVHETIPSSNPASTS